MRQQSRLHGCVLLAVAFSFTCVWVCTGLCAEAPADKVEGNLSGFQFVMSFGSKGEGDGQFNYIEDFELSLDGTKLLVTDALNATIQLFDKTNGAFVSKFGGKGSEPDKLVKPEGISVAPNGCIFVADYTTGFVKIYGKDFRWIKTFSKYGDKPGENIKSEFTCVYDGKYYMAEAGNHRVSVWDLDGEYLFSFGQKGQEDGQFNAPQACKVNSKGELIVTDLQNNRIQVFDAKGKFLRKWGQTGFALGKLRYPAGLAVDKHDNVYVTELGNNRVQVFDSNGRPITMFGKKGEGNGEFDNLHGCILDKQTGWLYVADTANNRIQVFKPTQAMAAQLEGTQRSAGSDKGARDQ